MWHLLRILILVGVYIRHRAPYLHWSPGGHCSDPNRQWNWVSGGRKRWAGGSQTLTPSANLGWEDEAPGCWGTWSSALLGPILPCAVDIKSIPHDHPPGCSLGKWCLAGPGIQAKVDTQGQQGRVGGLKPVLRASMSTCNQSFVGVVSPFCSLSALFFLGITGTGPGATPCRRRQDTPCSAATDPYSSMAPGPSPPPRCSEDMLCRMLTEPLSKHPTLHCHWGLPVWLCTC